MFKGLLKEWQTNTSKETFHHHVLRFAEAWCLEKKQHKPSRNAGKKWCFTMVESVKNNHLKLKQTIMTTTRLVKTRSGEKRVAFLVTFLSGQA